ncbi:hypothetical protein EGW08_002813 [Elysia chlorotica]|uniref:Uncharacterized protein n=1 Tax=Elysia chlorotica TaxID=188477 RepID=A0A3S1BIZ4_ELYCH|nr:hypothetical protein EGW08_002813 [Elysia chlorotica]
MAQKDYGQSPKGHHECEILGRGPEAAESESLWRECKKNSGHEEFISAQQFIENYLPKLQADQHRGRLRAVIDLTVRLRVSFTSPARPAGDEFSHMRGSDQLRLGTGFIWTVEGPLSDEPCPCVQCDGKTPKEFWRFKVHTAHHVVYNTEEQKRQQLICFMIATLAGLMVR